MTRRKFRVLHRLQFYLDFEILAFKQLCYSLQSHSPHWMDSISLVHLKAEHQHSTEFSLFKMNISHKSDLEYFYSNWYVGFLIWCTHHSVFPSSAGGALILKKGLKDIYPFQFLKEYILIWKIYLIIIDNLKYILLIFLTFLKKLFFIFSSYS